MKWDSEYIFNKLPEYRVLYGAKARVKSCQLHRDSSTRLHCRVKR